jgi:hypothetical protein
MANEIHEEIVTPAADAAAQIDAGSETGEKIETTKPLNPEASPEPTQALVEAERSNIVEVFDEELMMSLVEARFLNQGREAVPHLLKYLKKEWARKALLAIANTDPMAILNYFEKYKDDEAFAEELVLKAFPSNQCEIIPRESFHSYPSSRSWGGIKEIDPHCSLRLIFLKLHWDWISQRPLLKPLFLIFVDKEPKNALDNFKLIKGRPLAKDVFLALADKALRIPFDYLPLFAEEPWFDEATFDEMTKKIPDYSSRDFLEPLREIGEKPWCQKLIASWARCHRRVALAYVDLYMAPWAEPIVRDAAKGEPLAALEHSSKFWNQAWGPSVVDEALAHVKLADLLEIKDVAKMPWYDRIGLRLIDKPAEPQPTQYPTQSGN